MIPRVIKRIFETSPSKRAAFFLVVDLLLLILAVYLSFMFRFDGEIPEAASGNLKGLILLIPPLVITIFWLKRVYSINWSYVGLSDLITIFTSLTFVFLLVFVLILISREPIWRLDFDFKIFQNFPRSTIFISYFLALIFLGGLRLAKRVVLQLRNNTKAREAPRLLIVGAGDAGEQILRNILAQKSMKHRPIGFVDDDISRIGSTIHGYKVLGSIEQIPEIVRKYGLEEVFIAIPSGSSKVIRRAVELCRNSGITKIKILPSLSELLSERVSLKDVREVRIEDLLGREPVLFDKERLKRFIFDKTILVTGAAGSVGSELSRQIAKFKPRQLIILDSEETNLFLINEELKENFPHVAISALISNIQHKAKIENVFLRFQPEIIFHSAAYKHVPLMEEHPEEAVKNNILGSLICGEAAVKSGTKNFILISTDKAINPASVMGATKRVAEKVIQYLNQIGPTRFSAVRFGNVLDSRGSVVPIFREQIKKGGPIKITHPEMKRYFMALPEAVLLVIQAAEISEGGEIFVLDMGEPVKILDFAKEMIRLCGYEPDKDIPIVFNGKRPGEKMFEEMLTGEEQLTWHPKIFKTLIMANTPDKIFFDELQKLFELAKGTDKEAIKRKLRELVPEYHYDIKN